jgi:adenine-specific DNA-methyltransferase
VFADALPNCLIWRYELGNLSHNTAWAHIGQGDDLATASNTRPGSTGTSPNAPATCCSPGEYALSLADVASVRVGAVSGADEIYASDGNRDFVTSSTVRSGQTRRMIWCEPGEPAPPLLPHRDRLLARRIRRFDETNWWHWGRGYPQSDAPRIYVNTKTRRRSPSSSTPAQLRRRRAGVFPHARMSTWPPSATPSTPSTGPTWASSATAATCSASAASRTPRCPTASAASCPTA